MGGDKSTRKSGGRIERAISDGYVYAAEVISPICARAASQERAARAGTIGAALAVLAQASCELVAPGTTAELLRALAQEIDAAYGKRAEDAS